MSIALETLQVNVGLRCNMSCAHCHQASGPSRTEAMSDDVLDAVIAFAARARPSLVDVTGGAPELHPGIAISSRGLSSMASPFACEPI